MQRAHLAVVVLFAAVSCARAASPRGDGAGGDAAGGPLDAPASDAAASSGDVAPGEPIDAGPALDAAPDTDAAPDFDGPPTGDATLGATPEFRLIAPLSVARVDSPTPQLSWTGPADIDGARIEICLDRACARHEQRFTTTRRAAQPPAPLAAGLYYWRALAMRGGALAGPVTPMWSFVVSRAASTARRADLPANRADFNGDGFGDVAVARTAAVAVFHGSAGGLGAAPATTVAMGGSGLGVGDFNGDGYSDLVLADVGLPPGRVTVFAGGAAGLSPSPAVTIVGPDAVPSCGTDFGQALASGDLNGDGYDELVVSAPPYGCGYGRVYVFRGGPGGLSTAPTQRLEPASGWPMPFNFGGAVATADLNGDGLADLAASRGVGIDVFYSRPDALPAAPSITITGLGPAAEVFGKSLAGALDLNGDGYEDLVVGTPEETMDEDRHGYVLFGSARGVAAAPDITLTVAPSGGWLSFGHASAGAGDLDRDGYGDLVVGAPLGNRAYVYRGGPDGALARAAPTVLTMPTLGMTFDFSLSIAAGRDLNGDGYADLGLSATGLSATAPYLHVYNGTPAGVLETPSRSIVVDVGMGFGGALAQRASHRRRQCALRGSR